MVESSRYADLFVVTPRQDGQPEVDQSSESKNSEERAGRIEQHCAVDEKDEIKLDGRAIAVEELESAVRDLPPTRKSSLALQADKKASFGTIIKVMDALKLAGIKNLPAFTRGEK